MEVVYNIDMWMSSCNVRKCYWVEVLLLLFLTSFLLFYFQILCSCTYQFLRNRKHRLTCGYVYITVLTCLLNNKNLITKFKMPYTTHIFQNRTKNYCTFFNSVLSNRFLSKCIGIGHTLKCNACDIYFWA